MMTTTTAGTADVNLDGNLDRPKPLAELAWESRFVQTFPGDPEKQNFTRAVRGAAYSEVTPTPVSKPRLIGWAEHLAAELGISRPAAGDAGGAGGDRGDRASLELLAGNLVLPGMRPYAARYGGHQFGHWAGQLGDGRAITLGEVVFPSRGGRLEFQLKGPGPTPYSRRADGRAVLRSSLREFVCSEAMHFLGVPTTRALSLVLTGDAVVRDMFYDGNPAAEPGAIVCRVAPTFIRFGNFEIFAAHGEHDLLKRMTDYLIAEYYPELIAGDRGGGGGGGAGDGGDRGDVYARLLDEIARRTAVMVVHWMRVGFVHGVMNTDNMSALGVTIDYGPYGWLEPYDPAWTPNTTDAAEGRYRFGNQPAIALWNLGRLAGALFPLINDEQRVLASLNLYRDTYRDAHAQMLAGKLGLSSLAGEEDVALAEELFETMAMVETDYTLFFRGLSNWDAKARPDAESFLQHVTPAFYVDALPPEARQRWSAWAQRYARRVAAEGASDEARGRAMRAVNPKYVPRNYLAQDAIRAAERGDLSVLERLMRVLTTPYDELPGEEDLAARRPEWARTAPGCSALSCSS
ncbi:MAG TPA: YdiU family protein [Tepidisphaeraceae bacterium]|nr:YdiU family protein [Tepidisphaeraceae bacterium]